MQNKNSNLHKAKRNKNDEFYTQYDDIEKEINAYLEFDLNTFKDKVILLPCDDPEWSNFTRYFVQNFDKLGLKKLISTSYAIDGGLGKIFILDKNANSNGVDTNNLKLEYLKGNGDFRSNEIKALRDESDIIITNPPFSLFREFISWVAEGNNISFSLIANKNCVTYKEVFPLIKDNKLWLGRTEWSGGMWFKTIDENNVDKVINGINMKNVPSIWITNLDHEKRHKPLQLMTMEDNKKLNKKVIKSSEIYQKYDNYNAIEVSYTSAIPSDYSGEMGVPISFLDKYCPEQFDIVKFRKGDDERDLSINGKCSYFRILIKHKNHLHKTKT